MRIPQEIVDEILDHLATDPDHRSLHSSALVSKSWVPSCRRHLFRSVFFSSSSIARWVDTFPVPEKSPAFHIRDLRFLVEGHNGIPYSEKISGYVPWFTNVERMSLLGDGTHHPVLIPPSWRSPQSTTSLIIDGDSFLLKHIRDILVQLPNLSDLLLVGHIIPVDKRMLLGIGTALRGRFGGKLQLYRGSACRDTVDMLLEIPTGLHFTEAEIGGRYECLISTVRLAEACSETLMKLTCTVDLRRKSHSFFPSVTRNIDTDDTS